jgi:uncharacterized protein (DUF362 family)
MRKEREMTRREFFAAGAGLAGGAAFLAASPALHPALARAQTKTAFTTGKSRVILVKTDSRVDGVKRCLALADVDPFKGKSVLFKPNLNTSDETPGSTHNDTLRTLLELARDGGARRLSVGDRSGPEPTPQVFEKKGLPALAASFGAKLLNFDELGETGYVRRDPPSSHWKNGFLVARPVVETDSVVSTCCLKTHQFGGVFSMSLKNSVGIVPRERHSFMKQLHGSPDQRRMIAEINTAYKPSFIVLDGLVAFVDKGPMTGPRKDAGVFLAGTDRVAVDAVGLAILKDLGANEAIMKPKIFEQEQISWAATLELGAASPAEIEIVTGDEASAAYADKIRPILAAG